MSTHTPSKHWLLAIVPMSVAFTAVAWSGRLSGNNYNDYQLRDTLPAAIAPPAAKAKPAAKKTPRAKPFAKEIKELDEATKNVNAQTIKDIDVKKIQDDISRSIDEATKEIANAEEIDPKEVEKDVDAAIKEINEEKVQLQVEEEAEGIKNIDYKKIQQQIRESLNQVNQYLNSEEFKNSVRAASKPNIEEVRAGLEKTKRELDKNKINIRIDMDKARADIEKTKNELKGYQEMIGRMEKDGLLNNNEDYTIEYKNGTLYINDQKQPGSVSRKYKGYFKEEGTKISCKNGSFKISIE